MAPNTQFEDSSRVGDFEAEDPDLLAGKDTVGKGRKKRRMVQVSNRYMKTELPEQGSWHYDRKKEIIQKHPEVLKLYGQNPWSFPIMLAAVFAQTFVGIKMVGTSWPVFLFVTYTLGAYLNWAAMVMGHEGSHGLVFKSKALNKLHTIIAFLPLFLGPFGSFWSIEHMYHHQVVVDKMDRYGPQSNKLPRKLIHTFLFIHVVGLFFFAASVVASLKNVIHIFLYLIGKKPTLFPESYTVLPYKNFPQIAASWWFLFNMAALAAFNFTIYHFFGFTPILYFFISNGFCNGLHPLGMRQVQEHYIQRRGQPTNSVYSSWSWILLNIGYHNEHHDFPTIPWNRLPEVRRLAPEFYNNLFAYDSYLDVMWQFFTNEGIPFSSLLDEIYEEPAGNGTSQGTKKSK